MGGFTLLGPNYIIVHTPEAGSTICRCTGYNNEIDEQTEQLLVRKTDKVLDVRDMPELIQAGMRDAHLGFTREYEVHPRPMSVNTVADARLYVGQVRQRRSWEDEIHRQRVAWAAMVQNMRNSASINSDTYV